MNHNGQLISPTDLFNVSWETLRLRWKTVLTIQAIAVLAVVVAIAVGAVLAALTGPLVLLLVIPAIIVAIIGAIWVQAAQMHAIRPKPVVGYKEAYQRSKPQIFGLMGVSLLSALAVLGGLILLIIPGIIIAVVLSQAAYVYLFEKIGVMESLKRSKRLVWGRSWPVFGRLVLLFFVAFVVSWLVAAILPPVEVATTDWQSAMLGNQYASIDGPRDIIGLGLELTVNLLLSIFSLAYSYHLYRSLVETELKSEQESAAAKS